MGYFNYFIKCIIRNIAYKLCKPKVLFTVLLAVAILFFLHSTGYCSEWTDADITALTEQLSGIQDTLNNQSEWLVSIGVDVGTIQDDLTTIKSLINSIDNTTSNMNLNLLDIVDKINTLNTNILNVYNQLEENQQELLTELEEQNQAILEELQQIKEAVSGTVVGTSSYEDLGFVDALYPTEYWRLKGIYLPYDANYSYSITVYYDNTWNSSQQIRVGAFSSTIPNNYDYNFYSPSFSIIGDMPPKSTGNVFTYNLPSNNLTYVYFTLGENITKIVVNKKTIGILDQLNNSTDLQQQQNQLQQQQNQLQQEQNEILTDDNVETDGLEFATDDTVNPTTDGFNTLFNTVYNAFCNTSSEPLTITLPYINETFTIQPNVVSNGMQKAGLGVIVSLINSFYYFSVCLFIYKDISKIVDNLKSGNITSDCGNVKTEVL